MRAMRHTGSARAAIATVVVAMAAALATGCGGGGNGEKGASTAEAALTKKEFLKQGNAICDKVLGERDALAAEAYEKFTAEGGYKKSSKASRGQLADEVAGETVALYKRLVHELEELNPPANDANHVGKILSDYEAILEKIGHDSKRLNEAEPLSPNSEAASYGLITCAL